MPQDSVQVVHAMYEAFARRDREGIAQCLDSRIEWTSAENFIYADRSPYIGVDAVLSLIFDRVFRDWANFSLSPGEVLGGGDLVIASGRFRGIFRANGAYIDAQMVQVFQLTDGKISRCQVYTDTAKFKDAVSQIQKAGA